MWLQEMENVQDIDFLPVNIAVLTISDTRTLENDGSGDILIKRLREAGHILVDRALIKDEVQMIVLKLREWVENTKIDVVITSGGTGVTGRDVTPEAFAQVCEKEIPGFGELFRWISYQKIRTSTIQSRACAGIANGTYMFALPGSPSACKDGWDEILKDQLDIRNKPCNLVELMPRLKEC